MKFLKSLILLATVAVALPLSAATARDRGGEARVTRIAGRAAGESFVVSWRLVLDSLRLPANSVIAYRPVVEDSLGHTLALPPVVVAGRNQHYIYQRDGGLADYPDAIELRRKNGSAQTYTYRHAVPLKDWMREARVSVVEDTCGCGNLLGQRKGRPYDVNPHLERRFVAAYLPPVAGPDPVLSLRGRAYIDFPVNRTELFPDYHDNPAELHKIMRTIDTVRGNAAVEITSISIHGYASPEGPWDNNVRLARGRAATLKEHVSRQYDFPDTLWHVQSTPEDWAGLDSFLVKSNLEHRDEILAIVRSAMAPDPKNERIKREYPEQYRFIHAQWYPYLRHSDYEVKYRIRPMTDAEAERLMQTEPRLLSLNKLYRIANLYAPGRARYNRALETAARIYPDDPVANVNVANVALRAGDLERAERHLAKAGDSPEADHARGVLALLRGDYAAARQLLVKARDAGVAAAADNLRLLDGQTAD